MKSLMGIFGFLRVNKDVNQPEEELSMSDDCSLVSLFELFFTAVSSAK